MNIVSRTICGKTYTIEKRALKFSGPVLEQLFTPDEFTFNESIDEVPEIYGEYIEDIINLLETGDLSDKILSLPKETMKHIFDYLDLPFSVQTLDYPDEVIKMMFKNQWYRRRRYQKEYIDNWNFPSQLIEVKYEDTNQIRIKMKEVSDTSELFICRKSKVERDNLIKRKESLKESIKKQFGEYTRNILTRAKTPSARLTLKPFNTLFYKRVINDIFSAIIKDIKLLKKVISKIGGDFEENVLTTLGACTTDSQYKDYIINYLCKWFFDGSIVLAGGSMLNILSGIYDIVDYDFFFVGITPEQAEEKLRRIIILSNEYQPMNKFDISRTSNAITIKTRVTSQYILRIYKDTEEVLMGFDLAPSCFAYDGNKIFATKDALFSVVNRIIIIDFERLSSSYEYRCCKYANSKLFSIFVPRLPDFFRYDYNLTLESVGFNAILVWFFTGNMPIKSSDYEALPQNIINERKTLLQKVKKINKLEVFFLKQFEKEKITENQYHEEKAKINKELDEINKELGKIKFFSSSYGLSGTTLEELFSEDVNKYFSKEIWKVINPGQQTTGTFHRVVLTDHSLWYKDLSGLLQEKKNTKKETTDLSNSDILNTSNDSESESVNSESESVNSESESENVNVNSESESESENNEYLREYEKTMYSSYSSSDEN